MKCFFTILLTALLFGNPTKGQHAGKIASKLISYTNNEGVLFEKSIKTVAENSVIHKDYVLFSVCTFKEKIVSIGALRLVWVNDLGILKTFKI